MKKILESKKLDVTIKWFNYTILVINIALQAYQRNWSATSGWAVALMWNINYFSAIRMSERWRELVYEIMKGYKEILTLLDVNEIIK